MIGFNNEALAYELESIRLNRNADILQAVKDALDTAQALVLAPFTGDWWGVGSGIVQQTSTLATVTGFKPLGRSLSCAASVINLGLAAKDLYQTTRSAAILIPAVRNTGFNFGNVAASGAGSQSGQLYGSMLTPAVSVTPSLFVPASQGPGTCR